MVVISNLFSIKFVLGLESSRMFYFVKVVKIMRADEIIENTNTIAIWLFRCN